MARVMEVTLPFDVTDRFVQELRERDDILSLRVQRGISVQPPGDIVTVTSTNRAMQDIVHVLDRYGVGAEEGRSLSAADPVSLLISSAREDLAGDSSEGTWEELEMVIVQESNTTGNTLMVMGISGAFAAVGLATNALHVVIAGMLIAPGFEPLIRIPMGLVARSNAWRRGISQSLQAYGALLLGAVVTFLVFRMAGKSPRGEDESYLPELALIDYWTDYSLGAFIVTLTAGMAGAVLVSAKRSVLTGGVMIALALIPSVTLVAMGIVIGDLTLIGDGAFRWTHDVVLVLVGSFIVFMWKRIRTYRRDSKL